MAMLACLSSYAVDFKTFESKLFSIGYPADWDVTYESDECLNVSTEDDSIRFNVTFNDYGPLKSELQQAVDNWVYMKESHGHKVDQKLVKDDYALVRTIMTDEDDGSKTVEVWYLMITHDRKGFSGTIESSLSRANEAIDTLVEMLATLKEK